MVGSAGANSDFRAEIAPGVWRWSASPDASQVGTAWDSPEGWILFDPPHVDEHPLIAQGAGSPESQSEAVMMRQIEASRRPVVAVFVTSRNHLGGAQSWRDRGAKVWVPAHFAADTATAGGETPASGAAVDHWFSPENPGPLPGGIRVGILPAPMSSGREVAYLWSLVTGSATAWFCVTGSSFPVAGQTPWFDDDGTDARTVEAYLDTVRALQALAPDVLLPSHHAPFDNAIARATGYAGHIGRPSHARRAPPIDGNRYAVALAGRVLADTLASPVIRRASVVPADNHSAQSLSQSQTAGDWASTTWVVDPWACTSCGAATEPLAATCGGPPIPRMCPTCRVARRANLPDLRVMICGGGCCTREGARAVVSAMRREVTIAGLAGSIDIVPVSCIGECSIGPFVRVADNRGAEPEASGRLRDRLSDHARDLADETGETLDADSEAILEKWIPMVRPIEGAVLARDLVTALRAREG